MLLSQKFIDFIKSPCPAIWASNADQQLKPNLVRLQGVKVEPDRKHITFYFPLRYGQSLLDNFKHTEKLAFLFADIETNESYQIKGKYLSQRDPDEAEIDLQKKYIENFSNALEKQGVPKDHLMGALYAQPSLAVTMQVQEIYEQTPRIGTGNKIPPAKNE
jgi:hypothetical protein